MQPIQRNREHKDRRKLQIWIHSLQQDDRTIEPVLYGALRAEYHFERSKSPTGETHFAQVVLFPGNQRTAFSYP